MISLNNFGGRLKAARINSGFTQEKLAEYTGVSRTAVARWENDDSLPTLQNLITIAEILDVSTDYLLGLDKKSRVVGLSDEAAEALNVFVEIIRSTR